MKTFISQNINKIKLAPFPESIVLVATCTYHEGNDEFHAILQLAKPTESEDLGNNAKLFARDIATLNDTTVYSVGATFIATKKFTWQDVDM